MDIANIPDPTEGTTILTPKRGWYEAWRDVEILEGRLGLLHSAFSDAVLTVNDEDLRRRIQFLLRVADGYRWDKFHDGPEQMLRRKAIEVLAHTIFKVSRRDDRKRGAEPFQWGRVVEIDGVMEDLIWFFRPATSPTPFGATLVSNLYKEDLGGSTGSLVFNFARELAQLTVDSSNGGPQFYSYHGLRECGPELLHVMMACGDIMRIVEPARDVPEPLLARLRELALDTRWGGHAPEAQLRYQSAHESMMAGSQAGTALYILEGRLAKAAAS